MSDLKALPAQKPLSTWGAPTPYGPAGTPPPADYFANNFNPLRMSTHRAPAQQPQQPQQPQQSTNPLVALLHGAGAGAEGSPTVTPAWDAPLLDQEGGLNQLHPFTSALLKMMQGQADSQADSQAQVPGGISDMTFGMD